MEKVNSFFAEGESVIKVEIKELSVVDCTLKIDVEIMGEYNREIRNPIVTIIFRSEHNYRRLPLPIKFYKPCEGFKNFIISAGYNYSIKDFYIDDEPSKINITLEITYGNDVYTDLTLNKVDGLDVSGSKYYSISLNDSDIELNKISVKNTIIKFIKQVSSFIWDTLLFLVSVLLIPLFFVEALLSATNIISISFKKKYTGIMGIIEQIRWRFTLIFNKKIGLGTFKNLATKLGFNFFKYFKIKKNRVAFISCRRNTLSGNFEYIYKKLSDKNLDIKTVLDSKESFLSCFKYGYYLATSKVILVDDYIRSIYEIKKRTDNYLIQVWHACGAFKTFGFSRLSKEGCWPQDSRSHRTYDFCTVSSGSVAKYYAEAFGMSIDKVIATGVPRTDIFFNEKYKTEIREKLYSEYPILKDKKVILFAPTFRGKSKKAGHYPHRYFDYEKIINEFGNEYAIIIKHHPFVNNKLQVPDKYKNSVINLSQNEELNDLLFITDLLITDYSSVIFEASLLKIPMLFYTFDLYDYISSRGFYFEFMDFVPGKIVYNMQELISAIQKEDFDIYKLESFRSRFFDKFDGKSGERISKLVLACIKNMC